MDYFKLVREFYVRQSVNPLSTGQIALWHGLVQQSNQLGWPREFNMPNRTLEMLTGLSRQGIVKARNALKQSGLIEVETHGTKAATYRVVDIARSNSVPNSLPNGVPSGVPNSVPSGVPNSSAYLRQDKTKQNKTKKIVTKSKKRIYADDSKELQLANQLWKEIHERLPETKHPNLQRWADDIRKMHELDKRDFAKIERMIAWSQHDGFWQANILSAAKLREKYDQMAAQGNRGYIKRNSQAKSPNVYHEGDVDWSKVGTPEGTPW